MAVCKDPELLEDRRKRKECVFQNSEADLVCHVQRPQHQAIDMEGRSSDSRPANASEKVGRRSAAVAGFCCVLQPDAANVSAKPAEP